MAIDNHYPHPYSNPSSSSSSSREFLPFCRDTHRERAVYHPHHFPDFDARILLPTGSILHRNYLCFLWHDALEELRTYVRRHVTRPDDIYVSVSVAQLAGKGARTFARKRTRKRRGIGDGDGDGTNRTDYGTANGNDGINATMIRTTIDGENHNSNNGNNNHGNNTRHGTERNSNNPDENFQIDPHRHRRLLWESPDWFTYREEAVNSILGYFGTIHPGSVGWCAGTPYMKKYAFHENRRDDNRTNTTMESISPSSSLYALPSIGYYCEPEYPPVEYIPWMNEWGVGYRQCP